MKTNEIREKLERKQIGYISNIEYQGKTYVKAMKRTKKGIEYKYYLLQNERLKEIKDDTILNYFKQRYETKSSDIIY